MLDGEIIYLKGVGPQKADVLAKEYDIHTYGDLLEYFPFRMVDRSHISTLDSFNADEPYIVFKGRISEPHTVGTGRTTRLEATFTDGTGVMQLVWFQGLKWVKELLQKSQIFIVAGKPSMYGYSLQLVHPDIEIATNDEGTGTHPLMPVYHTTEKSKSKGITSKTFARLTDTLLKQLPAYLPETLPTGTVAKFHLMSRNQALRNMHYPASMEVWQQALFREKFEELFFHQLDYQYSRVSRQHHSVGRVFSVVGEHFNNFYHQPADK